MDSNLTYILLNPNGRLAPASFWRGYILLIAVYLVLLTIQIHGGDFLLQVAGMFSLMLIWPYLCVFGKRLHDAGQSAWWCVPAFLGMSAVGLIAKSIVMVVMYGEEIIEMVDTSGALQLDPELAEAVRRGIFLPSALIDLAVAIGAGYILAHLRSDRQDNQYGPTTLPNGAASD